MRLFTHSSLHYKMPFVKFYQKIKWPSPFESGAFGAGCRVPDAETRGSDALVTGIPHGDMLCWLHKMLGLIDQGVGRAVAGGVGRALQASR